MCGISGLVNWGNQETLARMTLEDGVSIFILASDETKALERFAAETAPAVREHVAHERK